MLNGGSSWTVGRSFWLPPQIPVEGGTVGVEVGIMREVGTGADDGDDVEIRKVCGSQYVRNTVKVEAATGAGDDRKTLGAIRHHQPQCLSNHAQIVAHGVDILFGTAMGNGSFIPAHSAQAQILRLPNSPGDRSDVGQIAHTRPAARMTNFNDDVEAIGCIFVQNLHTAQ